MTHTQRNSKSHYEYLKILRQAQLKATPQRIAIVAYLFGRRRRNHTTAEELFHNLLRLDSRLSIGTVYNTLHAFTKCGLIHRTLIDFGASIYDSNTEPHHHLLIENTRQIIDIPADAIAIGSLPELPPGIQVKSIQVIIRAEAEAQTGTARRKRRAGPSVKRAPFREGAPGRGADTLSHSPMPGELHGTGHSNP